MRDVIVDTVTVTEASIITGKQGDQWEVKMIIPTMGGNNYPRGPVFIPLSMAESIKKNAQIAVKLSRGRVKNGKEGSDKEWDYWWSCEEWGTKEAPTPPEPVARTQGAASGNGYSGGASQDQRQGYAWGQACNGAVHLVGQWYPPGVDVAAVIQEYIDILYPVFLAGPPQEASPSDPTADAQPPEADLPPREPSPPARRATSNPANLVTTSLNDFNHDHQDNQITPQVMKDTLRVLYDIEEPTVREGLKKLTLFQATEMATLIAQGKLAEQLKEAQEDDGLPL